MSKKKKKEEESKALTVADQYAVSSDLAADFEGLGLGAGEEIDTKDILIPNLMLTQGLTKAVAKGKVAIGKYVNSTNLTDMGDNVEALVIQSYKVWQEFKIVEKGKDEYLGTIDFYGNEQLPYQYDNEKGEACSRKEVLGFYVLLLDEIKNGVAFPYTITFKGGSKKAGRELTSHFAKLRSVNLPSFSKVFSFGAELIEDEHTYYVKTVDMGRDITREELGAVKNWIAELKKNKDRIKVDDTEEREEAETVTVEAKVVNESADGVKY